MNNNSHEYQIRMLPHPPFHIYFINGGEIKPKKIFVVTNVKVASDGARPLLFVDELQRHVPFDQNVVVVSIFSVN